MSNVLKFPNTNKDLEYIVELLSNAEDLCAEKAEELSLLEDKVETLREIYDQELEALIHRLGNIKEVPVHYLVHSVSIWDKVNEDGSLKDGENL
jgi:metal-sulfur cluster biosynthetic enzyme